MKISKLKISSCKVKKFLIDLMRCFLWLLQMKFQLGYLSDFCKHNGLTTNLLYFITVIHLPYKRIVPSVSPILFLDMHLYPPKSVDCKRLICKIISTAYILTSFSVSTYLSPAIIISPKDR
uniref:Uncharacterized protein n=1 Tax=Glossina brevipalpis TaxID=37001 RepID=A0A1A9X5A0_9MUSC